MSSTLIDDLAIAEDGLARLLARLGLSEAALASDPCDTTTLHKIEDAGETPDERNRRRDVSDQARVAMFASIERDYRAATDLWESLCFGRELGDRAAKDEPAIAQRASQIRILAIAAKAHILHRAALRAVEV